MPGHEQRRQASPETGDVAVVVEVDMGLRTRDDVARLDYDPGRGVSSRTSNAGGTR